MNPVADTVCAAATKFGQGLKRAAAVFDIVAGNNIAGPVYFCEGNPVVEDALRRNRRDRIGRHWTGNPNQNQRITDSSRPCLECPEIRWGIFANGFRFKCDLNAKIVREILLRHQTARILEVGNVLSHYFPTHHDVVDKYEVAPGVINKDIVEFVPTERYDLILSISTLEHVGWDEEPREPAKILCAIEHLRNQCLAPGGQIVASLPIGYNEFFDGLLRDGKSPFTTQHFLKRVSKRNYWVESDWEHCRDASYGRFVAYALCIGLIQEGQSLAMKECT